MNIKLHIGLDVHKISTVVATADSSGADPVHYGKWPGSNQGVERGLSKLLKRFELEKQDVRICYEAGPTGFVLARRLHQLGYDCIIVAPSSVPKKSGDRIKTDRRDASGLARLLRAGELKGIHIPPPHDEAVRDLCRARTDAADALAKSKQQLGMFLLRNGVVYSGKTRWSQAHMNYLRRMKMADPAQQLVLEETPLAAEGDKAQLQKPATVMPGGCSSNVPHITVTKHTSHRRSQRDKKVRHAK
jgi:transposase